MELQQGYTSVMKYIREFRQLSRYAEEDVNTEEKRKKRFLHGLNPFVKMHLRLSNKQTYQQLLDAAITFEDDYKNSKRTGGREPIRKPREFRQANLNPTWSSNLGIGIMATITITITVTVIREVVEINPIRERMLFVTIVEFQGISRGNAKSL